MSVGLTKEQLEKFEKDGLLVLDHFLSPEEVTNIRKSERRNPSIFYIYSIVLMFMNL